MNARLRVSMGDRGCLSLFGSNAETHRMFAEHLTSEYFVKTEARGRSVDEWKQRPEQPDNHWFDCLVGRPLRLRCKELCFSALIETFQRSEIALVSRKCRDEDEDDVTLGFGSVMDSN